MARPAVVVQQTQASALLWLPVYVRLPAHSKGSRVNMLISILLGRHVSGEPASSVPSLLGMDVMRRCVLTYDGPSGQAELTVPAF